MPIFLTRLGHALVPCHAATLLVGLVIIAVVSSCGMTEKSLNRKIQTAILMHDLNGLEELVHDNPDLVFHKDEDDCGDTLLHMAVGSSEEDVTKFLLANKADVNAKDNLDLTPLHFAATTGQKTIAELLLAKGADVNAKDNKGRTPLDSVRNKAVAELLLAKGADVNIKDNDGMTPLQWAAFNGHEDIVDFLREHGGH